MQKVVSNLNVKINFGQIAPPLKRHLSALESEQLRCQHYSYTQNTHQHRAEKRKPNLFIANNETPDPKPK